MISTSKTLMLSILASSVVMLGIAPEVLAGPKAKSSARSSVNKGGGDAGRAPKVENNRGGNKVNANNTRGSNNKVNINNSKHNNVNIDRDVNINVDNDGHGCRGGCYDYDDHYHPVATAAAVTATVALTSAAIGSVVNSVPPTCVAQTVRGVVYQQCGNVWYQPQYVGNNVTYVVINPSY